MLPCILISIAASYLLPVTQQFNQELHVNVVMYNNMDHSQMASYFENVNKEIPEEVALFLRKIDPPHNDGEFIHAHFNDTSILNINGTWTEGNGFKLEPCVVLFLQAYGFTLPQNNDQMPEYQGPDLRPIEFTQNEIRMMAKGKELPSTMRKIDRAHKGAIQDHIHFNKDENDCEAILNKDGSWDPKLNRPLSDEERDFIQALGWTLP